MFDSVLSWSSIIPAIFKHSVLSLLIYFPKLNPSGSFFPKFVKNLVVVSEKMNFMEIESGRWMDRYDRKMLLKEARGSFG